MKSMNQLEQVVLILMITAVFAVAAAAQPQDPNMVDEPDRNRYALLPGEVQVGGLFGASYLASGIGQTQGLIGGEVVVGLPHNFAVFGEGAWHSGLDLGVWNIRLGTDLFDLGTGIEWTVPNRTPLVPYLRAGVSLIHIDAQARFGPWKYWVSGNKIAASLGGGVTVHLNDNFGFLFDIRGFDGSGLPVMVRTSVGFFYRFK
jgi:hypothetical protein